MLRVNPIYGSQFDDRCPANTSRCTLVEYAGIRVLWNVGWKESLSSLPDHDLLLISDSTLGSIGALPLYHANFPMIRSFATYPTIKMGQMALYDQHASLCLDGIRPPYTLEELDSAISSIQSIKYSQTITISHPQTGVPALSITAQRAGHVVGASFFVLQRLQDDTIVVLTSTYHIARELHLDSSTLLKYGATPDVLITYPGGPAMAKLSQLYGGSSRPLIQQPVVTQAEKILTETVLAVLRRDGNCLLPVDSSGRVLEILILLSQHWDRHRLAGAYNLCWLSTMAKNTIEFARSQLEWMATPLGAQFDSQRGHPFALKNISICSSLSEFEAATANGNPSCVLASGTGLDSGMARDLLLRWADNQDHAVIFTDSSMGYLRTTLPDTGFDIADDDLPGSRISSVDEVSDFTTAGQLLSHWCQAKLEGREMDDVIDVDIPVPHREPLTGLELKAFQAQEEALRLVKKEEAEKQAMLREVELAKGQLRLGEDEEKNKVKSNIPSQLSSTRQKKKSRFDSTLFIKFSKPLNMLFETKEEATGFGQFDTKADYGIGGTIDRSTEILEDEYGIAVSADRFTDIVTGVDPSKFSGGTGRIGDEVKRGFGYSIDGRPLGASASGGGPAGGSLRLDGTDGTVERTLMDERVLEAEDLSEGNGIIRGRNGRPPTKIRTIMRALEVLAEINYIPLEGKVDAKAARQSVRALQPRQVLVLGGTRSSSSSMSSNLVDEVSLLANSSIVGGTNGKANTAVVFTPNDGESVVLDVGHAAYSVRLLDIPLAGNDHQSSQHPPKTIEFPEFRVGECYVSHVNLVATGKRLALDGSLVLAAAAAATTTSSPPSLSMESSLGREVMKPREPSSSIFISDGDILLTDLRAEMTAQGMKAEYSTHSGYSKLVVNGKVVVMKDQESGKISIEGPLCEDFYAVRSVVHGQFTIL